MFSGFPTLAVYQVHLFKFFTVLSYANSAVNPFLYAFTNEAFKSAFTDAFSCVVSKRSRDPADAGGGRRRDAGAGEKRASDEKEVQAPMLDQTGYQDYDNVIQLETMETTSRLQVRQSHNDVDSQKIRVIVHLEQQQQNEPDDDQYSL